MDWPTPRASEGEHRQAKASPSQLAGKHGWSLGAAVNHQRATPRAEFDSGRHRGTADTLHSQIKDWSTPNSAKAGNDTTLTCSGDGRETPNKLGWAVAIELGSTRSTPTVNAAQNATAGPSQRARNTPGLAAEAAASAVAPLSPDWVETLMGFPVGWTIIDGPPAAAKRSTPASPRARRRVSRSEPQG